MERRHGVSRQAAIAIRRLETAVSIESYIGGKAGREDVELEDGVLTTESGCQLISRFRFEDELLGMEI